MKHDRTRLLDAMTVHVLEHGLANASLRPLAKAAGTSDRMLIYHFGSKDGLIEELLLHICAKFTATLQSALPPGRAESRQACIGELAGVLRSPWAVGSMDAWFDILSAARRGGKVHRQTGYQMMAGFLAWLEHRLPEDDPDPQAAAACILAAVEGLLVLETVGHGAAADLAVKRLFAD